MLLDDNYFVICYSVHQARVDELMEFQTYADAIEYVEDSVKQTCDFELGCNVKDADMTIEMEGDQTMLTVDGIVNGEPVYRRWTWDILTAD